MISPLVMIDSTLCSAASDVGVAASLQSLLPSTAAMASSLCGSKCPPPLLLRRFEPNKHKAGEEEEDDDERRGGEENEADEEEANALPPLLWAAAIRGRATSSMPRTLW